MSNKASIDSIHLESVIRGTTQLVVVIGAMIMLSSAIGCKEEAASETVATESEEDSETDTGEIVPQWKYQMIYDGSVGIQTKLMKGPAGQLGLTFFANENVEDGVCDELEVNSPIRLRQPFYFAEKTVDAEEWDVKEVERPVVTLGPTGLSLAYTPDGNPSIAFTGGDPEQQYCGGNDAVLATRVGGTWQFETASSLSGDSVTGLSGSDEGMVVGLWPSLQYSPAGEPGIIHKDVHFGALQSIDQRKTDAEFAWRQGGTWIHEAIDANEGAGEYNALIFVENMPVAFYGIPVETQQDSRLGVWAAKRGDDGSWSERVQLHSGAIYQEIVAAVNPVTGEIVVVFYSAADNAVRVRKLVDFTQFSDVNAWTNERASGAVYDEGRYVSMAFTPLGKIVLAYHRCRMNSSSSDGCDQNDEAAILAIQDGTIWRTEEVARAALGSCGEHTGIAVDDTGVAHVVYRCTQTVGDQFSFRLFEASKLIEAQ